MSVDVTFQLDTNQGLTEAVVRWPVDKDVASTKLKNLFAESDAMARVKDHESGSQIFVNTMKVANVVIEEVEE